MVWVEFGPLGTFFSSFKEIDEEVLSLRVEAFEGVFERSSECDFVGGVKWCGCFEVALEF